MTTTGSRSVPAQLTTSPGAVELDGAAKDAAAGEPGEDGVATRRTIVIERISPILDGGRNPVKRVVGDVLLVTADIFAEGHGLLDAALLLRAEGGGTRGAWREAPMRIIDNDRWSGSLRVDRNSRHRYAIEAWRDEFGSLLDALRKKVEGDVPFAVELEEARLLLEAAESRAGEAGRSGQTDVTLIGEALAAMRRARSEAGRAAAIGGEALLAAVRRHPDRRAATRSAELPLMVDRERARFGAWYELFPRSQGRDPEHPAATTLDEATWRLPDIARMGFDVVYLPPVHPIGRTNRKGANNALKAKPGDPGSPYAIGSSDGGHDAVATELGGLEAFVRFREAVEALGMELALDIAIQAAPDHPWVKEHPEWFRRAPDGSIKFAENPPKKYQDIYPIEFGSGDTDARAALWRAWRDIFQTWIDRGVRIFRVDNPHTKPIPFWRWLIADVQRQHPDVIFLSEAFTRPRMMEQLAKIGFTQSYTYFTWRESRDELRDYFTELSQGDLREYFRGNLFTNTPDINPHHTDHGRPAFVVRTVLAATLGSSYGIYSGWELCESTRLEDREEYLASEKYEIRARDWNASGNIKPVITMLNRLRREWRSLQLFDNLRFQYVTGERTLFYRKALPAGRSDPLTGYPFHWREPVFVAVNCDPTTAERAILHPDLPAVGIGWDEPYELVDLVSGRVRTEQGADVPVDLDPHGEPFRIFTVRRASGTAAGAGA
ncbi:MAG TPA: alpha-1,4-glucan--maltose-1-phosphate maltosyltransferase [Candidatus Limnocylindria bacterium]|jgi:starch synthase (maltosyl-transferring)|nr:alpha-1,4-glucan--maltose-1-phosphate maltosyltransferase [Candidatus Limnocylindria bacterium]